MQGKVVLCIGGSSGMGRGIAEASIAAGARVIVTSRTLEKARVAAAEMGCEAAAVDLESAESIASLFDEMPTLDHLAITAGAVGRSSFADTPPGEAEAFMNGKLWSTHRCIWEARSKLSHGASITLITGGYSTSVSDEAGHVHIAFRAVEALARVVAVSLAPIRCNVIRPGFIDSSLWDFMDEEERRNLRSRECEKTLTGKLVSPRDFGEAAIRIMTMEAVTGAVIPVDGGRHLWSPR